MPVLTTIFKKPASKLAAKVQADKGSPGMSLDEKMDHFRKNEDMSAFSQGDLRLLYGRFKTAREKEVTGDANSMWQNV
eukprot:4953796-Alexandrium_andersonii.AAC.1